MIYSGEIDLFQPSFLIFLIVCSVPVYFFINKGAFKKWDLGFLLILIGSVLVSLATFIDYLGDTGLITSWLTAYIGKPTIEGELVPYLYLPGLIPFAAGIMMWLPAAARLMKEIDQRKVVEHELRILADQLSTEAVKAERANESKSDFLATMTHELRTPLNAIIGFSQLLKNPSASTSQKQKEEYLGLIESSGSHLLEIINDMLDLSKLEAGKVEARFESFDLNKVLNSSFSVCKNMADRKQIIGVISPCDIMLETDTRIMKQVFINVLSNAIKFTPVGGEIRVDSEVQNGHCLIKIMDTGVGMTEEEILIALEPFSQVEGRYNRENAGTGLGLPLVLRFMELLGGSLKVESTKDIGTTINLTLPMG